MSDLIKRLRGWPGPRGGEVPYLETMTEAADKIGDMQDEIEKLRAALQTARRDAREQVARYHDLMAKMAGSSTELQRRSSWVHNESAKDIRSGIDIRVLGEKE